LISSQEDESYDKSGYRAYRTCSYGENLVMNMESKGFTVTVFNRSTEKVTRFVEGRAKGKNIIGTYSIQELVDSLKTPRKIMIMVKAGKPVDDFIDMLIPYLDKGDIIIDGGNSHFPRYYPQDTVC
jgi:6-phosphogluconate dehydrogenase